MIQDVELNGLPSLRSLQKRLLETDSERSQNLITIEKDGASGEPFFFYLKVQKPEPSPTSRRPYRRRLLSQFLSEQAFTKK